MKNTVTKKILSVILCLALIVSWLPLTARAAGETPQKVADPSTMDGWKELFLSDPLSTENAGGVWTDKSVFTDASAFAGTGITQNHAASFLVALSAIASNMAITGMSNMPTDTMLVLDVSGSMNDNTNNNDVAEELVEAANDAIHTLLDTNQYNRVGVVLYSGPTTQGGATSASDAVLILPLGRYTTGADNAYLSYSVVEETTGHGKNQKTETTETVSLDDDVVYEGTNTKPSAVSKTVVGGTYIQKGINLAAAQFTAESNTTTVVDPVMGTLNRKPILVLMSDGAPTVATTQFTAPADINLGDGTYTNAAIGFVTQLTAAYAKANIEAKYGSDALFYTLGLGTTSDEIATSVLDPANSSTALNDFWTQYNAASEGGTVTVQSGGYNTPARWVTKIAQSLEQNYVDKYFPVDSNSTDLAAGLKKAFQDIVGNIQLQSQYFPTLVAESEDLSGYVSFADRIGEYMEVTDIKGVLINNTLYSGAELAKNFAEGLNGGDLGTYDDPTTLGHEMVAAVRARMGLESDDAARTLIGLAHEHGQLSYTSDTQYSNYIGWYANAAGQFLGFWHEGITTMPEATGNAQTDPVFIVKSYGYLGAVDESHGVAASDMMYATVQVRENIATGEQIVAFAVPAALIPVVTYNVTLDQNNDLTELTASGAEHPIRLVYEVALDSAIDPFTVHDLVSEEYLAANTDEHGNVSFYTNQYETDNTTGYGKVNTYSYFNPSRQNEKYYYLENAPVYADTNGTLYTGETQPSGTLYRAYTVYVKDGQELRIETHYRALSDEALATAVKADDGNWYIPAGNVHVNVDGYTVEKESNPTDTLTNAYVPFVDAKNHSVGEVGYNFYVGATLGNNGRLLLTPATGIALTKTMAPGAAQPDSAFRFVITNVTDSDDDGLYPARVLHADGSRSITMVQFENGKATVALNAGETFYIGGMAPGAVFTVEEVETVEYIPNTPSVEVTIVSGQLAEVEFINADRGTGNLTVTKEVLHTLGSDYQIPQDQRFTIHVRLSGIGTANATFETILNDGTGGSVTTDENGCFTLELAHNQQITVLGLPEGTVATVTEPVPGEGFTASYWEDDQMGDGVVTITDGVTVSVTVMNSYEPDEVYPVNVKLSGTKIFTTAMDSWNGAEFEFQLQQWNGIAWETIATATASESDPTFTFTAALSALKFTEPGAYYFQVLETGGGSTIDGITYDATLHTFGIIVTDADMDGRLEIGQVISYHTGKEFSKDSDGNWSIEISFENEYNATGCSIALDVRKELVNPSGSPLVSKAGFQFGLYDADGQLIAISELTDGVGEARILLNFDQEDVGKHTYTLKEIVPADAIDGMTYDDTVYTVVVEVVDNGDGTTSAAIVSIDGKAYDAAPVFTNTYIPDSVKLPIDFVSKKLTGRDLAAGEFTFEVRDTDGNVVATGTNDANGKVTFDKELSFDAVGTWFYTVVETSADGKGVTTDKTVYTVMVTVTDAGGALQATYSVLNVVGTSIVFENTYKADETAYIISGTKTLTGRVLLNDEFTFVLEEAKADGTVVDGGLRLTAKNFTDGSFTFSEITYTAAGTYYYVVSEQAGGNTAYGIRFDETKYLVAVTVTDDLQGKLEVTDVTIQILGGDAAEAIAFVNEYVPDPTSAFIPGNKTLVGKLLGGGDFSFQLFASDENWTQGALLETVANGADGSFTFQSITYDTAGEWYYLVKEVHGGETIDGVTYDDTVYRVCIEVTDDLVGQLHATVHVYDAGGVPQQSVEFRNVYTITGDAEVTLEGTKTLNGRDLADGEFTFELYQTDETFTIAGAAIQTAVNTDGKFRLTLTYGPEDVGNTYYYVVLEQNAGQTINGVTYSTARYYITVTVEDDGVGGIKTTATITDGTATVASMDFVNTYEAAKTQITLDGNKTLTGKDLVEGEFTFVLEEAKEDGTVVEGGLRLTAKNFADGSFAFPEITYTAAGTYYYVVSEQNGGKTVDGIHFDETKYLVAVTVADDLQGKLEVTNVTIRVLDGDSVDSIRFVNEYDPSATSAQIVGNKTMAGKTLSAGDFSFQLYASDENWTQGQLLETVTNGADGSFAFQSVSFDTVGKWYYLVKEVHGGETIDGVTYDATVYRICIEVTDDLAGQLHAAVHVYDETGAAREGVAFQNVYTVTGDAAVNLECTKTLTGKDLAEGEFTFELYKTDETFAITGEALQSVTNGADGSIRFGSLVFDQVGIYYFVVMENTAQADENVTYDTARFYVTVEVTDNGLGALEAQVTQLLRAGETTEEAETITFANVYTPDPDALELDITAVKTVVNTTEQEIGPENFIFLLENVTLGTSVTVKSDADGLAVFHLTFTEDDIGKVYTYKLSEVNDGRPGVIYSTAVYNISIAISLDENNTLVATIINNGAEVTEAVGAFENTYTPPDNPKTGDTGLSAWISMMAISAGSVLTLTAFGKKKEEDEE